MKDPELIFVPWSKEIVEKLTEYQQSGLYHPYTCMCGEILIATSSGWVCVKCDYIQIWAYESTLNIV
jgi:hypothetical protein